MENIKVNLFPNTRKEKETQPDYRGKTQDGKYEVAGWKKQGQNGEYISLTIKEISNP